MDINDLLYKQLKRNGVKLFTGTTCTEHFWGIIVRSATATISSWTDEDDVDVRKVSNIVGVTLTSSDPAICVPDGKKNKQMVLSSGEVWLLR